MKSLIAFLILSMSASVFSKETITLTSDNTLVLDESFRARSVTKLQQEAAKMDANLKSGYPIYLVMYTPGGSIQAGLELIDFLSGINRPVHTITMFSASMGFQTVQHLGKRFITRYGVLMSHKARGGFRGEFGGGISQLDSRYGMWLRRINMMDEETVKRTNGKQTIKSYRESYAPELWLNGEEAVKEGYADDVAIISCDLSLKGTKGRDFDLGFFKVKVLMSKCPAITAPVGITASILTNQGEMDLNEFLLKNGKFGKECFENNVEPQKDFYGNPIQTIVKETEICARDKELTLDKIRKAMDEKESFLNRDLRNHIEYSY